ncbi:hypothetical protein V8C42DRAFT_329902 [Trichoderma barbatum]
MHSSQHYLLLDGVDFWFGRDWKKETHLGLVRELQFAVHRIQASMHLHGHSCRMYLGWSIGDGFNDYAPSRIRRCSLRIMCDIHWIHRASNACDTPVDFLEAQHNNALPCLVTGRANKHTLNTGNASGAGISCCAAGPDCSPTRDV